MSQNLPSQVRQQMEEIEAIEAAIKAEQAGVTTPAVQTEPDSVAAVPEITTPEPVTKATVEPPPAAPVDQADSAETWRNRYLTLQGMQKAEAKTLRELRQQFDQLQAELVAAKEVQKAAVPPESLVTDKDESEFGKDLIDLQRRVVREMVTPLQTEMDTLKKENDSLRAQLGQTGTKVAEMSFEQRLATKVPDFDAVNTDPRWVTWLDEHDPILRGPRRIAAQSAFERGDVDAVSDYVTLWRSSIATPAAPVANPKADELQTQVAPVRSAASAAPQDKPGDKVYTADEADAVWTKITVLNRGGKYEEANKLETELTAAYNTGRVR